MNTLTAHDSPYVSADPPRPAPDSSAIHGVVRCLAALHALVALAALTYAGWLFVDWLSSDNTGLIDLTWLFIDPIVGLAVPLLVVSVVATVARGSVVSCGAGLLAGALGAAIGVPSCGYWLLGWQDPEPVALLLVPAAVLPLVLVATSLAALVRMCRRLDRASALALVVRLWLACAGTASLVAVSLGACFVAESALATDPTTGTGRGLFVASTGLPLILTAVVALRTRRGVVVHRTGLVVAVVLALTSIGLLVATGGEVWYLVGLVLATPLGAAAGLGLAADRATSQSDL